MDCGAYGNSYAPQLIRGGGKRMVIRTENLCKVYGAGETQVKALSPCNFTIASGEQVAIVGCSGSGKTTLLHLLGGLDRPTKGKVFYDNEDIFQLKDKQLSNRRLYKIGFVFQMYNLVPELTAYENIILPALLANRQPDETYKEKIISQLSLEDRLDHLPSQLSGGQQQRVALARSLINKPEVLLCDEPTGNLDSKNTNIVMDLLRKIAEELVITLIVVTHNERIAKQFPRILSIEDGMVEEVSL